MADFQTDNDSCFVCGISRYGVTIKDAADVAFDALGVFICSVCIEALSTYARRERTSAAVQGMSGE